MLLGEMGWFTHQDRHPGGPSGIAMAMENPWRFLARKHINDRWSIFQHAVFDYRMVNIYIDVENG